MTITIRREFVPVAAAYGHWQTERFTRTVWQWEDGIEQTKCDCPPDGYARGLLTGYIDGQPVDIGILDVALALVPVTRADIERALMTYHRTG